jgi:hypothetical protein
MPPKVSLVMGYDGAAMTAPAAPSSSNLNNAERALVGKQFAEYRQTGKARETLSDDDKASAACTPSAEDQHLRSIASGRARPAQPTAGAEPRHEKAEARSRGPPSSLSRKTRSIATLAEPASEVSPARTAVRIVAEPKPDPREPQRPKLTQPAHSHSSVA